MKHLLPSLLLLTLLPSPSLAQNAIDQTLKSQREQMEELIKLQQIQRNQRQIERMQDQLIQNENPQPQPQPKPEVVVVEQKVERNQPSGLGVVLGTVIGATLTNSSLNCYGGRCSYGYNSPSYYGGGYYYPRRLPSCSWGTGYLGCR